MRMTSVVSCLTPNLLRCCRMIVAAMALAMPWTTTAADEAAAILGEWHGTSTCTDRVLAPACNDEVVVYEFSRPAGAATDKLHLKADKVVDGKRLPMGELELTWSAADKTWSGEFRNERVHILWSYQVSGDTLTGTLIQYPSKGVVRRASAKRKV